MDAILSETLIKRRDELLNELKHIEELIKIYRGPVSNVKTTNDPPPKLIRTKFPKKRHNVKGQVIIMLKGLGDEFYVSDLTKALKDKEPNKDNKLISNKARNYIYILKKEGTISGRLVEGNKYAYKIVNK